MILLEIVKKLLKIHNLNLLLVGINFVGIKFDSNSDLEEEDIIYRLISAEAFAARADVRQEKKPVTHLDIIDLIKDPRI